jgi:hypothetical protein
VSAVDEVTLVDDFLEHYGVKGMKWGQTRSRAQIDASPHDSFDVVAVKEAKTKIQQHRSTDVLSNRELQTVVTRMNLEQQYSRLVNEGKSGGMHPLVKKQLDAGRSAVVSLGVRHAEDKISDFIAKKNPAAGIIIKSLVEAKRSAEGGKKKNK